MPGASSPAVVLLVASLAATTPALSLAATEPTPLLQIQDPTLLETSGLAVSALHEGVLWTHADGGAAAEVRAFDAAGETVATVTLAGIDPYDPEALAPGVNDAGKPALFLGDLGDNLERRPDVSVFRFTEPRRLADQSVEATWFRFTYSDGPHDAEALLVHPRTGRMLIATKDAGGGGVYAGPRDPVPVNQGTNRLVRVADAPLLVTDGAYLPDGRFVLRTYGSVLVYDRPGHQVGTASLPLQPQGESVAADGDRLLVGSEGPQSAVYAVPVPAPSSDSAPGDRATAPPVDREPGGSVAASGNGLGEESGWRTAYRVARVVAIILVLTGVIAYFRRSRRR